MNSDDRTVERIEVSITGFARGPDGVGKTLDGRVIFVEGAIPGDTVSARITETHRTWMRGVLVDIISPSDERRTSPCIHHVNDACGGCPWIEATEALQRREKFLSVQREVGRITSDAVIMPLRTDIPAWGYRRRTRFGYRPDAMGFRRRKERRIFQLERCQVLDSRINDNLARIRASAHQRAMRHEHGNLDVLVDDDGQLIIGGLAQVFHQPSATTELVLTELILGAVPKTSRCVVELFAGGGTFTEPLSREHERVIAYEVDSASVANLRSRCPSVQVVQLDLFRRARQVNLTGADTVVLDPPRAGAKECIPIIINSSVERVVYVSCDLSTLCRDIRSLYEDGFNVDTVTPIDAFPQTPHIELVAVLSRRTNG